MESAVSLKIDNVTSMPDPQTTDVNNPSLAERQIRAQSTDYAFESAQDVVVLVHGIRDYALWQGQIRTALKQSGLIAELTNYGRFNLFQFLIPIPFFRRWAVEAVWEQIRVVKQLYPSARLSIIAHSFGTYIVSYLIKKNFDLNAHRIIFCGSVVSYRFKFQDFQGRFTGAILNEVGTRDIWPALAESVTWGYGSAGTYGFRRPLVGDRWHNGARHGYLLTPQFCQKFWVPYLKGGIIIDGDEDPKSPPLWLRILSILKIKYLIVGLVAYLLYSYIQTRTEYISLQVQPALLTQDSQLGPTDVARQLIFAEMLASISSDDERIRVAELYLRKPLTNGERLIVIQIRQVIRHDMRIPMKWPGDSDPGTPT